MAAHQPYPRPDGRSGHRRRGQRVPAAVQAARANARRQALALLLLIALSIPSLASCGPDQPTRTSTGEAAQVALVVDGDTVELDGGQRVRYIGINAPESDQPFAADARAFNQSLVEGWEVWVETDVQESDQYGRLLAYVWVGDTFVNLELVRQGYAHAYTVPPNVRYADDFAQAEREAREAGRGLWTASDAPVRITALHYDAPGRDDRDPNGEWIELTNTGNVPVDLNGYTLRDQGPHRYTFGAVLLPPGGTVRVYSGLGTDTPAELYWGLSGDAVWNNDGDAAYLRDPAGTLVDSLSYTP